jgi:hypothetical protein
MASKKINYLSRDFASVKEELIKFSNKYYPELSDNFNDASVGAWFIDLVSDVADSLNYHIDRTFQETNLDSANSRSAVLNMARTNGLKIPGRKASTCEVEISCTLPTNANGNQPDWEYAPILQSTSILSAGNYNFQLTEDVKFAEQFNEDGYSNRKIVPSRGSNGLVTGYTVSKSTIVVNGNTKIYRKVINGGDLQPFMEVVLPESNVLNIESIIFKETSNYSNSPRTYEFYIDDEEYKVSNDSVMTYRFFETDSLADQWRFGSVVNKDSDNVLSNIYEPHLYDDYTETTSNGTVRTTRYYKGEWKPLTQKFITEYTNNGYMKIIFGSGNSYAPIPSSSTTYGEYVASNIINNDMLGVLPQEGWTMFVLYRVGGGVETNLAPGSINNISIANIDWGNTSPTGTSVANIRGKVVTSLTVTNLVSSIGGKDAPSTEEIKNLMKYNTSSQNRAVTVKDYESKLMQMPPKYGAPFRASVIENNNKIEMSFLGLNGDGKLDSVLPQTLVENAIEYMSNYKQINDYIEARSGRIYNIGFSIDVFVDKNYNTADVVKTIINTIKEYFSVEKRNMGEDIFVGDLEKEITMLDGVISLINLEIYKIWGSSYSSDKCPLPVVVEGSSCDTTESETFTLNDGGQFEKIDLNACEYVLYNDYNSMYEILNENTNIQVRVKLR